MVVVVLTVLVAQLVVQVEEHTDQEETSAVLTQQLTRVEEVQVLITREVTQELFILERVLLEYLLYDIHDLK
jgi:hypothetical protein